VVAQAMSVGAPTKPESADRLMTDRLMADGISVSRGQVGLDILPSRPEESSMNYYEDAVIRPDDSGVTIKNSTRPARRSR
jgi:hypothetical protein